MNKTLLLIGASAESYEGINIAKHMGLKTIVADGNPNAVGLALADYKIIASIYDGPAILAAVKTLQQQGIHIDGVIAMCADVPETVAMLTNALQLPGLNLETARLVADKLAMKDRLKAADIPIPLYCAIDQHVNVDQLIARLNLPLIIKPVDSRGARGVQLIDKPDDILPAINIAEQESPSGRAMAEEYLAGPQVSTETLIEHGKAYTIGFSDRNYEWLEKTKPFFIENGGDIPSHLNSDIQKKIISVVEKAALALGIENGVAKGDMVWTERGAKVIEIAGRLSGGYFSTTQIPLATGVPFVEQAIKLALGEPMEKNTLSNTTHRGAAIRYLSLKPGKIKHIFGVNEAKQMAGVALLNMLVKEGDEIINVTNHAQRSGLVICSGESKQQAVERAENALSKISIIYE